MKLEKREITLNERDSITDALYTQKNLLRAYINGIENAQKQETRKAAIRLLSQTCEDLFFLCDLQKDIGNN